MPSVSAASMLSQSSVYHRLYSTKPESLQQNEIGHVCHVTDHIVDVSFVTGLPPLFTALQVMDRSAKLLLEVAEHLSDNTVRTVAMQATKGVVKGQRVISTGSPIRVCKYRIIYLLSNKYGIIYLLSNYLLFYY
jgi:F0F1-type ATP synthase alpha subunit